MKKRVIYGELNYAALARERAYFVDKTDYIAKLETVKNRVFLRPRHFGKSLLCSILRYYYDLNFAEQFEELFSHTKISQNPTGQQNQYLLLFFNFSTIYVGRTLQEIESSLRSPCNTLLRFLRDEYPACLSDMPEDAPVADNLANLLHYLRIQRTRQLYIIIDEYDNFANQLITSCQDQLYRDLTADDGFLKAFSKP